MFEAYLEDLGSRTLSPGNVVGPGMCRNGRSYQTIIADLSFQICFVLKEMG